MNWKFNPLVDRKKPIDFGLILNYTMCFIMVGILILGTFLLPQFYGYQLDRNTIGRVIYTQRDEVALSGELILTVLDRTAIVTNLVSEGGMSMYLNLDSDQLKNGDLIDRLKEEIAWAVSWGVLPQEVQNVDFNAEIGNLQVDYFLLGSNTTEYGDMALWRVSYNDYEKYQVDFLLDAENYKIYYAELGGSALSDMWLVDKLTKVDGTYMMACMSYYEAENAEDVYKEKIFKIEDAGSFGWWDEREDKTKLNQRAIIFGFDVFWEYFRGQSLYDMYQIEEGDDTTMIQNAND
ncbi:MAG: hypothetical protein IJW63_03580 [Lachnospiraceae bacterium]|nr:hypothetical protein [Lachnospiraceae bacterium]